MYMISIRSGIQYQDVANPVQGPSVGGIREEQDNQVRVVGDLEVSLGYYQRKYRTQTEFPEMKEQLSFRRRRSLDNVGLK